jgi:hypothetical protein
MNDAIEILDEIEQILEMSVTDNEQIAIIYEYIQQKRIECAPITNAKWECACG